MDDKELIRKMAEQVGGVPSHVEIFAVRQHSLEEMTGRMKRFLGAAADACHVSPDRADWVQQADRTLVRLTLGARAVLYHASGAMKLVTGLAPMESLFDRPASREQITRLVEKMAERLRISDLAGPRGSLGFERLWQIKASAADRKAKTVDPVLCRVVGTYRHIVGKLPVWGPASVAIKLAGGGALDAVTVQMRETSGEAIDWASVLAPEEGVRRILVQVASLMGRSKVPLAELVEPRWMSLGYIALSKRKAQHVLAPHYVAAIGITGQEEAQAYQLMVPATEKTYLPLCLSGNTAPPAPTGRTQPMLRAAG